MITFCSFLFRNSVTVILLFFLFWHDDSKKTCLEEHFLHLVEGIMNQNLKISEAAIGCVL